jgi:hypothetical protein
MSGPAPACVHAKASLRWEIVNQQIGRLLIEEEEASGQFALSVMEDIIANDAPAV